MVGAWPMGHRLEAGRLAQDLGVSITPVRDSLNRLVGERLVDLVPGIGFHVPHLTERGLRDLLDFNLMLLLHAVGAGDASDHAKAISPPAGHAARTDALFSRIAMLSGNEELVGVVRSIGLRLHAVRAHELALIPTAAEDIASIQSAFVSRDEDHNMAAVLERYHDIRKRKAEALIARLRAGDTV